MGTFPPQPSRWSMEFYYPNQINDFWRIMGIVFYDNRDRFYDEATKQFRLKDIKDFLIERGIAMSDTGAKVRRLKDNASDKWLEIVEPVDLESLLKMMPDCHALATTGEKAASILAELTSTPLPRMGEMISTQYAPLGGRELKIFRMPSSSRAYPLALDKKAAIYADMMKTLHLL